VARVEGSFGMVDKEEESVKGVGMEVTRPKTVLNWESEVRKPPWPVEGRTVQGTESFRQCRVISLTCVSVKRSISRNLAGNTAARERKYEQVRRYRAPIARHGEGFACSSSRPIRSRA
jgi:hypothetical protein